MKTKKHTRAPQGRPRAGEGEDRREKILNSALDLFARQGVAGTTIAQIAKDSGVTSAMVHYYFRNREGLLDAIAAERLAPAMEYIWAGISGKILSEPDRLVTMFVDRLLETVERMPQLPLLWSREILNVGGLLRERVMALVPAERFTALSRSFSKCQQKGQVNRRIVPALILTSVLAVVMLPLAAQDILGKLQTMPALDKKTLRRHALALLLDGLCPEKNREARR